MNLSAVFMVPGVFLASFVATYFLVPLVSKVALAYGLVDQPGARRLHRNPIPRIGGVAVFAGFHISCALMFLLPITNLGGMFTLNSWLVFLAASSLLLVVGLIDDIRGIRPLTKLLSQMAAASIMFAAGISAGQIFGFALPVAIDLAATILWFLVIINAFNLIDGMDGLAAGLASIAALGIIGSLLFRHLPGDALIMIGFLGACLAFLRYNFNPASIFLGDTGSMFLGFTVAAVSLGTCSKGTLLASIGVPLLAVGVPIFDTLLAIWRRSVRRAFPELTGRVAGTGVMHFDMDHLHHRLIRSGLTQRKVAVMLYLTNASLVFVGLASLLFSAQAWGIFVIAFVVGAYIIARHVAYVELWDSGVALIEGFRQPSNPVLAVLLYPVVDFVLLSGGFLFAAFVCLPPEETVSTYKFLANWFFAVPVVCGVPFIVLFLTQTYSRVWSRARIAEFVFVAFAVTAGVVLAWATSGIISVGSADISIAQWVLYGAVSLALITGIRGLPRAINDLMSFVGRKVAASQVDKVPNVVLYGAGYRGILYLSLLCRDSVRSRSPRSQSVLGLIDDDRNLRGRLVHGYRVLGGLRDLIGLLRGGKVQEVILTAPLSDKRLARLRRICQETNSSLYEWKPISKCLVAPVEELRIHTKPLVAKVEPLTAPASTVVAPVMHQSDPPPLVAHG
ncbi:MAG: hypothetical protein J0M12_10105 [Deltaproteobacteria bacterium]|nr:hypothetical protein [Deltaproteobacteria bacterium]